MTGRDGERPTTDPLVRLSYLDAAVLEVLSQLASLAASMTTVEKRRMLRVMWPMAGSVEAAEGSAPELFLLQVLGLLACSEDPETWAQMRSEHGIEGV